MLKNGLRIIDCFVMLVIVILLTGCKTIIDTLKDNKTSNLLITKSKELTAMDISIDYIINAKNLVTYNYEKDPNISYVSISEFITFLKGGIVDLNISKSDVMTISYTYDISSDYQQISDEETYTYEMTIDALNDVISFNDFEMISYLNISTTSQNETDLFVSNIEISDNDPSLDIDLSSYGMDIVLFEDEYYIPLYLANLFFTGANINVYEMNDYIYILDNSSDLNELFNKFEENDNISASDVKSHTKNYLALYFDYFYGLKDFKNIDTYRTILEDFKFEEKDSFFTLDREIERFLNTQNDLHTSLISAGYMNNGYEQSMIQNMKLSKYLSAYSKNRCNNRQSEISYKNYKDTFVIQVNAFSFETRNLLKPIMEKAKNYEDIVFDVSCNPGGYIIGVIELLSYMTDEEIPISYINTTTGAKITEYYDTTQNAYLDKNYYVYTTQATYSAANLFASIVKDQELGLTFGKKTSGGASAITYTVLPDGAIIVNSSNLTFINKNEEVIEDGIEVDIDYYYPFDWNDFDNYLNRLFKNFLDITVDKNTEDNAITYEFDVKKNFENLKTNYKLSIYDLETNKLILEKQFTSDNFSYSIDKIESSIVKKVEVSIMYDIKNISKEEIIYTDIIDDHSDTFDTNETEIQIDENFKAYSHGNYDKDAFIFTVSESGLYRIELNENQLNKSNSIYDEDGILLGKGYDFELKPGVYCLVTTYNNTGEYSIKVRKLEDDNTGSTIVNLQNGTQTHKLYYDYLYDDESFEFILSEDSLVTLSWNTELNYSYIIKKSTGEYYIPDRLSTNKDETIIMDKGTYIIKIDNTYALGEYSLTTTLTTDFSDYSGDKSLESDNYGKLIIGTNTMEFLTLWDEDIYYIDITEEGSYVFEYDNNLGCVGYIISKGFIENIRPNYFINLSPGRHFFVFKSYGSEKNKTIDFKLIHDID